MEFGLIIVGDEILSGKRADKHMPKVIELLAARGLALSWVRYAGDDPRRLTADIAYAFSSGDMVFCCGGIGATPDDHTRQSAAAALGVGLTLHPEARDLITQRVREMAVEKGEAFDPDRADNVHRLNMGCFPEGAHIIPNPYNKIPGFWRQAPQGEGAVFFVPGFPVMAWPMVEWVLDHRLLSYHRTLDRQERSVIVFGAIEAVLTPLMVQIEAEFPVIKVFSLPSVDHPQWGKHIELGVKGPASQVEVAYEALRNGLVRLNASLGPEVVR